jgi:general secretion pathway protein J
MRHRSAGFTLLEVLAALAVLGLLMVALTQGVRFGMHAFHAQAGQVAGGNDLGPLDQSLRALIERIVDPSQLQGRGPVIGDEHRLNIVTVIPPRPDRLAISESAALIEVDDRHRLVLVVTPSAHVQWFRAPPAQEIVLAENVAALDVGYFKGGDGGGTWLRTWPFNTLPTLVRLRLVFPEGDPRRWPDIVAAPQLGSLASRELLFAGPPNRPIASRAAEALRRNVG